MFSKTNSDTLSIYIIYYTSRFTSLCKTFTYLSFSRSFSMPCAPFSMLDGPGGTGCEEVRFPVHGGWDSRDVSMAGMYDCVKESKSFVIQMIIGSICTKRPQMKHHQTI